jgi:urea carboxylase-associated protein 2
MSTGEPPPPLYDHEVPGGAAWSVTVRRGRTVTFTATGPNANLSTLVFASDLRDRLNIPDTLKAQMSACIKAPMVLMSDRGLALASVTESSLDWHDALGGFSHDQQFTRFGPSSYGEHRNDWRRSARTGLISELTKRGLGEVDLHGCVNFFSKLAIADDERCGLAFVPGHCRAGSTVTLRTEQDVLLVCAATPHPMDPAPRYSPDAVRVAVGVAKPITAKDRSVRFRAESARALAQTALAWA